MQDIVFYVAANTSLGICRDCYGVQGVPAPTMVRGAGYNLRMRLFADAEGMTPLPVEQLRGADTWQWCMDDDFDDASACILMGDNSNISVGEVADRIGDTDWQFTEVCIPLPVTDTVEMAEYLGNAESKNTLNGELAGYDAEGKLVYLLQVKGFTVRNRIWSGGSPTELAPEYLTASQVLAMLGGRWEMQFCAAQGDMPTESEAGTAHFVQEGEDTHFRQRTTAVPEATWTDWLRLPVSIPGPSGKSSHLYVVWAADADGKGFSLIPKDGLRYRAELVTEDIIETPTAETFAGCVWQKCVGDYQGDMEKTVYDCDGDGVVDRAARADSVPYEGVTGRPVPTRQGVLSVEAVSPLPLDVPILIRKANASDGTLTFDFSAVRTDLGGEIYIGLPGDVFTWEYWVRATSDILSIAFADSVIPLDGFPQELLLCHGMPTLHVFTVRARYREASPGMLRISINYAYSEEA